MIQKVTQHFVDVSATYIKWPNNNESIEISNYFNEKCGVNGVIGAIDGSHIRIKRPIDDQEVFYNRKGYHSIVLQAICNHKKMFTNIFCGEAGSQHDGRVFRKSKLYGDILENRVNMQNYFLVADTAYPVLSWVIPPFKDNGTLTLRHRRFNKVISSIRISIEHSFGLLKGRFRRLLHGFENTDIEFIVRCVSAACVIHNICIISDDLDIDLAEIEDIHEPGPQIEYEQVENRRNELLNMLFPN